MVATNSEEEVKDASLEAFQALPDISAAIQALTVLKAIGPATASGNLCCRKIDKIFTFFGVGFYVALTR